MNKKQVLLFSTTVLAIGIVLLLWSRSRTSVRSIETNLYSALADTSQHLGLDQANSKFVLRELASYQQDVARAANRDQVVRIEFEQDELDIWGFATVVNEWAASNGVELVHMTKDPRGASLFVRPSDHEAVTNFLASLTVEELSPFE